MKYKTYFQKVTSLSHNKKQRMADIYFQYYQGSDQERFYSDLRTKDEVLFLEYGQQIVGFSAVQFYSLADKLIVYSGDTIVMPEHWYQQSLHKAWIQRMGYLKQQNPTTTIYWFLLVKGYKTYKYLVLFAKHFYPHWQLVDANLVVLANQLASEKFGTLYRATTGVVECPQNYGYLKPELAQLTPSEQKKLSAQFFLKVNPYYYQGHELVCLCELTSENLKSKFAQWFDEAIVEFADD